MHSRDEMDHVSNWPTIWQTWRVMSHLVGASRRPGVDGDDVGLAAEGDDASGVYDPEAIGARHPAVFHLDGRAGGGGVADAGRSSLSMLFIR